MLSGASVRYRFYSRWGVTGEQFSRIVFSYSVTFWLGLLALGGLSLVLSPLLADVAYPGTVTMAGRRAAVGQRCLRRRGRGSQAADPREGISTAAAVGAPGRCAAAALGHSTGRSPARCSTCCCRAVRAPFPVVLGAFLAAQILGLASHVPGGVGVFEGLMVLLLKPYLTSAQLLPALVVYRAVYYLLPLSIALIVLAGAEISAAAVITPRA